MQLKFKPQDLADMGGDVRRAEDLYGHRYQLSLTPYTGVDFSRRCFVFPGQSAAVPEMGKVDLQRYEILQKRFAVADALAEKLGVAAPSLYIENPTAVEPEQLSAVQCLALYTISVGLFELLLLNNEKPSLLTSHSFGEYAALVASGIAKFEDVFAIVLERDRACPPAHKAGVMIAVSATPDVVRKAIGSLPAFVANTNSPQQTVLSVGVDAAKATQDALKKAKLAIKVLNTIPQPYHSALLAGAAARLETFVRDRRFEFSAPRIPVLSSVTGKIITADTFTPETVPSLLAKQLTAPVDFVSMVQAAVDFDCRTFVELAHHKVCTPWVKDILADRNLAGRVAVPPVLVPPEAVLGAAQKAQARNYDSKLVGFLNKVVSSVTGYSISEISLSNNFQEDLGIDSIKKAQIILNFLEAQGDMATNLQDGIVMSEIRSVEDILAWYMSGKDAKAQGTVVDRSFGRFAPVWVDAPVNAVDLALATLDKDYAWVAIAKAAEQLPAVINGEYSGVIFYDDHSPFAVGDLLLAMQNVFADMRRKARALEYHYVCDLTAAPEVLGVDSFIKSLAKEMICPVRIIQFDHFDRAMHEQQVLDELALPFHQNVRFVNGQRQTQSLQPRPKAAGNIPTTVAAIGGSRGVTRLLLQAMAQGASQGGGGQGTKNIAIMGRRSADAVAADLAELQAGLPQDGSVTVTYFAGDAGKADDLKAFVKQACDQFGTIDLFINAGGTELSAIISQQTPDTFAQQCAAKVGTTRLLGELCQQYPITRVNSFSSIAGEFGSPGQSGYAYANMVMTYLSLELNRQLGRDQFSVLSWPAWDRIGMTDKEETYKQMYLAGYTFLDAADGQRLYFEELADSTATHTICTDFGQVSHIIADMVTESALNTLFPGAANVRSPLPLTAWTLRNYPDLKNHMVLDHAVVPMSLTMAMFFYMGYLENGQAWTLHDIKATSFMLLHQKESPYFLDYHRTADGALAAEMRSNDRHLTATLRPTTADEAAFEPFAQPDWEKLHSVGSQYEWHELGHSDFKKGFGVLDKAYYDDKYRSYATIAVNPPKMRLGNEAVNGIALVCEGLLQLGGLAGRVMSRKANAPVSVKRVYVNPKARRTDTYTAVCDCTIISDDLATGELYAYNQDGEIFIHIHDAQVRMWGFDEA